MRKLGALDGNFLYTESDKTPNHISSMQIFELPALQSADDYITTLKDFYLSRINMIPYLTCKVKFLPGNMDHPVWVKDTSFDIENHITRCELPAPGTFAQLEDMVAKIHAELMDRNKPLWHVYVITGLKDGNIAYYNQAHHACIDGVAGQAATQILMDTKTEMEAALKRPLLNESPLDDDGDESMAEIFRMSTQSFMQYQLEAANRMLGNIDAGYRYAALSNKYGAELLKANQPAPKTHFNKMIEKERRYAAGEMSVADLKAMGKVTNCKLNDVFMAACSGGLRRYLERTDDLPRKSLKAGCPVSLRQPGSDSMDNQVTMMMVGLATDIPDPLLRLKAIVNSSTIAKDITQSTLAAYNPNISTFGLPAMITRMTKWAEKLKTAETMSPIVNMIISNVPGPRETLYANGAKMLTSYPVSIPVHGQGMNITATSYIDKLYFSITSCAVAIPDARVLRDDIATAYNELLSLLLPDTNKVTDIQTKQTKIITPERTRKSSKSSDSLQQAS